MKSDAEYAELDAKVDASNKRAEKMINTLKKECEKTDVAIRKLQDFCAETRATLDSAYAMQKAIDLIIESKGLAPCPKCDIKAYKTYPIRGGTAKTISVCLHCGYMKTVLREEA